MISAFLFGFAVCFSLGLLLNGMLAYIDTRDQLSSKSRLLGHDYRWERAFDIVLGIVQICLLIAGMVGIVAASRSSREGCNWLEMGVMCYLQLAVGTNLTRVLRFFQHPRWTIWLTYIVIITTVPDTIPISMTKETYRVEKSPVLARFAIASLLSSALSRQILENHKCSGVTQNANKLPLFLNALIITNAVAALAQLCGAMLLTGMSLAGRSTDIKLRQSVFLLCTSAQLLCYLPYCFASVKRWITR